MLVEGISHAFGDETWRRVEQVKKGLGLVEGRMETNAFTIATTLKETEVKNPCCNAYVGRRPVAPTSTNSNTGTRYR